MDNTQDNNDKQSENIDLKKWMLEHPKEYGDMSREMGEADLLDIFLMGQSAFAASPEFQKRLEDMIDLDEVNVNELVGILKQSGFAETIFTNPENDEDWEQRRLPFAAWLKHGRSAEMVVENIEDAISLTGNRHGKWQLSKFLKSFMKRIIEGKSNSKDDLKEYLDYRNALSNDNIVEWALNGIGEESAHQKETTTEIQHPCNLKDLIASQDIEMVSRIGEWIKTHPKGIDIAYLFVALIEAGEIDPNTHQTRFRDTLKLSFPESKTVGLRQIQKDVRMLQSMMPHGKRYGKDEHEHRAAIDMIKCDILRINPEDTY